MAKVPRVPKAPPGKYEGKAFLDYDEASDYLGIKRTTLYHHVIDMEIQTHKFKKNTRRYLAMADVKRIEKVMDEPWIAEADSDKEEKRQLPEELSKPVKTKTREAERETATEERPWYLPEQEKNAEEKSEDAA